MPSKKNMAARYASAHARRESRRRAEARARMIENAELVEEDETTATTALRGPLGGAALSPGGAAPPSGPEMMAPRPDRAPVARAAGAPYRPAIGRAPVRPNAGLATMLDYSYLRGDLQRILLLSGSLLILLVVLNLLLNR